MLWWGSAAVVACAVALLAGLYGHGMWAAVGSCVALGGVGILIVRLAAARTQLERLKDDTKSVTQCLSGGLITTDLHGRITRCNPAAERILQVPGGELLGSSLEQIFGERAPLLYRKLLRSLHEGNPIHRFEMQMAQPEGPPRPIGLSTSMMTDSRGLQTGLIAIFQDLSEVRRMQERVRRSDRLAAVGQLSASIAHEIRNPLAAITNSVDMLRDELFVEGEHKRLMDLVVKEGERLNRILDDFLEYARTRPLESSVAPVRDGLEDVVTLLQNHPDITPELRIGVYVSDGQDLLSWIDEEQMKQVYVNLALNAFQAMKHRGTLDIRVERVLGEQLGLDGAPYVALRFRDSGPGIKSGDETKIFEPFHTTNAHGTGLGLSVAAKIVESHGGRLEASNIEGGGAEFTIYLPEVT